MHIFQAIERIQWGIQGMLQKYSTERWSTCHFLTDLAGYFGQEFPNFFMSDTQSEESVLRNLHKLFFSFVSEEKKKSSQSNNDHAKLQLIKKKADPSFFLCSSMFKYCWADQKTN